MRRALPLFALLALAGCHGPEKPTKSEWTFGKPITLSDPWVLNRMFPTDEPGLLWNGLLGVRIGPQGLGMDVNGRPLPAFLSNQFGGPDERILAQPNPLAAPADFPLPKEGNYQDFAQSLDMKSGVLTSSWKDSTGSVFVVTTVIHPSEPQIAARIVKTVGGSSTTEYVGGDRKDPEGSFDKILDASKKVWAERWKTDIEVDGPPEDQQAIHSWLFYLRSSINPKAGSTQAISPFGLSRDTYLGHVFWDADIWVFPALALVDPDIAKTIPEYRIQKADQARKNYAEWIAKNRPTARGSMGLTNLSGGLKYPWESSTSGAETVPGPSRFEDHITGSVCFGLAQAASLGLVPFDQVDSIMNQAATFYLARSVPGPNGREIKETMSPDENFTGNNDLYTNLLASWLPSGKWPNKPTYKLPRQEPTFLTYDDDLLRSYKQAAAVLSVYPLQYPPAEHEAAQMMERFGDKAIKNGPAMTDAVHSIIYARLGQTEKAYEAFERGLSPFMQGPLGLFTEKRTKLDAYFTTGAAGCLQAVLYGFMGIRIDSKIEREAAWSLPLKRDPMSGDRYLSVVPHLPKEWNSIKFWNLHVLGKTYSLCETRTPAGTIKTEVTKGD